MKRRDLFVSVVLFSVVISTVCGMEGGLSYDERFIKKIDEVRTSKKNDCIWKETLSEQIYKEYRDFNYPEFIGTTLGHWISTLKVNDDVSVKRIIFLLDEWPMKHHLRMRMKRHFYVWDAKRISLSKYNMPKKVDYPKIDAKALRAALVSLIATGGGRGAMEALIGSDHLKQIEKDQELFTHRIIKEALKIAVERFASDDTWQNEQIVKLLKKKAGILCIKKISY